ncbi:MAG: hypothetical protein ACNYPE_01830 [Candidatus Azotimanducaceae bacterium WSBS_2022_MAG_OTU7]
MLANPDTDAERRRAYTQAMHNVEHLAEEVGSVALIPVGFPKGKWGRPRREAVSNSLHWKKW